MGPIKINRYQIKAELKRGGMSTVYLAHDPHFERDVALKVLPEELKHKETFRARFEREAKTIASLDHPAIVPVYDYGEHEGQIYLVFRFMTGGSLADRLVQGPLELKEAAAILQRIASALDEAHEKGVIHRDLKPSNILFDQRNDAFIADFGIVKLLEADARLTSTGGAVGTPAYMSPEQLRGDKSVDGLSDIYALGVLIFEMLTAHHPYHTETPMGMAVKHIIAPVPQMTDFRDDLPHGVQDVITRAMSKNPRDRYPTAAALAEAITNLAANHRTSVNKPEPARLTPAPTDPIRHKYALLIANSEFEDGTLAQLPAPNIAAAALGQTLQDPRMGGFDEVTTLINQPIALVQRTIAYFLSDKEADDLLLLYYAGHAIRDGRGRLFLALKNTEHDLLPGTALPLEFITEEMDNSRARRQVFILDCAHSDVVTADQEDSTESGIGSHVGIGATFVSKQHERMVLAATDTIEFTWEGQHIVGQPRLSRFTEQLVKGLETGAADMDTDGAITLDELFNYVYERLVGESPTQAPRKWSFNQSGDIVIAHNPARFAANGSASKNGTRLNANGADKNLIHEAESDNRASVEAETVVEAGEIINEEVIVEVPVAAPAKPNNVSWWERMQRPLHQQRIGVLLLAAACLIAISGFVINNSLNKLDEPTTMAMGIDEATDLPTATALPTNAATAIPSATFTATPRPIVLPSVAVTAAPSPSPTPTIAPSPTPEYVVATAEEAAAFFNSPDPDAQQLDIFVRVGESVTVIGLSETENWLLVVNDEGQQGWVTRSFFIIVGPVDNLPVTETNNTPVAATNSTTNTALWTVVLTQPITKEIWRAELLVIVPRQGSYQFRVADLSVLATLDSVDANNSTATYRVRIDGMSCEGPLANDLLVLRDGQSLEVRHDGTRQTGPLFVPAPNCL